tara:strand:+ start:294 stop:434 length:141 start_codon:yes stop_codon:yes gene_type:complete
MKIIAQCAGKLNINQIYAILESLDSKRTLKAISAQAFRLGFSLKLK